MKQANFYQVLGVAPDASADAIRAAYVRLAKLHHPDLAGHLPQRLHEIQQAYRCLADVEARTRHDRSLAEDERQHAERQRRIHRRLDRYERRHPLPPPRPPWYRRWRAMLVCGAAAGLIVIVSIGLFGAESG